MNLKEELKKHLIEQLNLVEVSVEEIKDDAQLQQLVDKEPLWELLEHKEVVEKPLL